MKQEEKIIKHAIVCYLVKKDALGNITHVCLAKKTRKIGAGCRNGYGGGIEPGETEINAVVRELAEETNGTKVLPENLEKMATVYCHNQLENGDMFMCPVHMYIAHTYEQEPQDDPEGAMIDPRWYDTSDQSFLGELMPADRDWLPDMLSGKKMMVHAYYTPFQKELYKPTEITFVSEL